MHAADSANQVKQVSLFSHADLHPSTVKSFQHIELFSTTSDVKRHSSAQTFVQRTTFTQLYTVQEHTKCHDDLLTGTFWPLSIQSKEVFCILTSFSLYFALCLILLTQCIRKSHFALECARKVLRRKFQASRSAPNSRSLHWQKDGSVRTNLFLFTPCVTCPRLSSPLLHSRSATLGRTVQAVSTKKNVQDCPHIAISVHRQQEKSLHTELFSTTRCGKFCSFAPAPVRSLPLVKLHEAQATHKKSQRLLIWHHSTSVHRQKKSSFAYCPLSFYTLDQSLTLLHQSAYEMHVLSFCK